METSYTEKETSFGTLGSYSLNGKVVSEMAIFKTEGKEHKHDEWEECFVLGGKGVIVEGDKRHTVKAGDIVFIPPNVGHWMIPEDGKLEIFIVYNPERRE